MPALYWASVTLHVLAAVFWLGGMLFLGVVGAPVLRAVEPPALRAQLFAALGLRFRTAGWVAIGVLLVTGVANLHFRGWLRWDGVLGSAAFWRSALGHALAAKLAAVVVMLLASAVHDFWLGPAAGRAGPGSAEAAARRAPRPRQRARRHRARGGRRPTRARRVTGALPRQALPQDGHPLPGRRARHRRVDARPA